MKKIISIFCIAVILIMNMAVPVEAWSFKSAFKSVTKGIKKAGTEVISAVKKAGDEVVETIETAKPYKVLDKYSYKIPNLNTTFVPQGLCKILYKGETYRLITAYDYKGNKESVIYIMDEDGKYLKEVSIYGPAGGKNNHVGGITEYNDEVWIASTGAIYRISEADLFSDETMLTPGKLTNKNIMNKLQGNYSFCTYYNGMIWIGTFDENKTSTAYGYTFNSSSNQLILSAAMQIPKKCQGMVFKNNTTVIFSTSYGVLNSTIYQYTIKQSGTKNGVPYYKLDKKKFWISAPSRSQQIYLTGSGNLYVLFESASKKFDDTNLIQWEEDRVVLIDL